MSLDRLFTRAERAALLFLAWVFFLGWGLLAWRKAAGPSWWAGPGQAARSAPLRARIPINRAGVGELAALPGIGSKTARRITVERQRGGPFLALEDLKRVPGISGETLERIAAHVRFD